MARADDERTLFLIEGGVFLDDRAVDRYPEPGPARHRLAPVDDCHRIVHQQVAAPMAEIALAAVVDQSHRCHCVKTGRRGDTHLAAAMAAKADACGLADRPGLDHVHDSAEPM